MQEKNSKDTAKTPDVTIGSRFATVTFTSTFPGADPDEPNV